MILSLDLYERAKVLPGRSCTRSKAPGRMFDVGAGPMYASHGHDAILVDVEGREYIDMLCGLGAISLGYDEFPDRYARNQRVYSLPHVAEINAAEAVLQHVAPWASHVRFVKTGSEATHAAYRIAKAATGRSHVFVGDWAYHGWHEWCSFADGAEESLSRTARRIHHNEDLETCHESCYPAAVFIEPHRWEPVHAMWLRHVREFCTRVGALLVFDEMIYGGRWALGGATEYFGVTPDLACYGKAIGNGAPIACVVGRDALKDHGEIVSGTYSGEAGSLGCVLETLRTYTSEPVIETLWRRGRQLRRGLAEALAEHPIGAIEGAPVHQRITFTKPEHGKQFAAGMARRGVLYHPDCINVCFAHTEAQIERVIEAAADCVRMLA